MIRASPLTSKAQKLAKHHIYGIGNMAFALAWYHSDMTMAAGTVKRRACAIWICVLVWVSVNGICALAAEWKWEIIASYGSR